MYVFAEATPGASAVMVPASASARQRFLVNALPQYVLMPQPPAASWRGDPLIAASSPTPAREATVSRRSGRRGRSLWARQSGKLPGMSVFTAAELAYLAGGRQLGRLATVGADGTPHVVPVAWIYNAARDTLDITGYELERTKK